MSVDSYRWSQALVKTQASTKNNNAVITKNMSAIKSERYFAVLISNVSMES